MSRRHLHLTHEVVRRRRRPGGNAQWCKLRFGAHTDVLEEALRSLLRVSAEPPFPRTKRGVGWSSEHDTYRDRSGARVQVDGSIVLTNSLFRFSTIFTVVPASTVPSARSGVILGQAGFLDRMIWTPKPRAILEYHGEEVKKDLWGEIHVVEYVDATERFTQFLRA